MKQFNPFKDITLVEKNGMIFQLHWKYRFDPVTMMVIAGVGMSAYGQYQQGQAAKEEGESAQAIAEYNAKVSENQAIEAQRAADYKASQIEKEGARLMGRQKTLYGKSGVLLSGTPLGVMIDSASENEWDRLMTIREGQIAKGYYNSQATSERMQGKAFRQKGKNAYTAGIFNAGGTALSGFGNAYQLGMFGKKTA